MKVKIFLSALFFIFVFQVSWAQVPNTISYQGVLKNADGTLVSDGTYSLIINLYQSETGGTAVWSETQSASVTDGIFNVILGSETSLDIPFDKQYWLGITIGGGSELTPRSELTSVPYSLNTKSIPDGIVTESKIVSGAVTPLKINTSGAVSGQSLIFDGSKLDWCTPSGAGDGHSLDAADGSPTDAVYVDNEGNVGIGTTIPSEKLEVDGNIKVSGTGNGIIFPDGTVQSTASVFSGVDWSSKFPRFIEKRTTSTSYLGWETVVAFTGSGYLMSINQHIDVLKGSSDGMLKIVIDGILKYAGALAIGVVNPISGVSWNSPGTLSGLFRFSKSLEIYHFTVKDNCVRTIVTWVED